MPEDPISPEIPDGDAFGALPEAAPAPAEPEEPSAETPQPQPADQDYDYDPEGEEDEGYYGPLAGLSEDEAAEAWEQWGELAEQDPVAAAEVLADLALREQQAHTQQALDQYHEAVQGQLDPVLERENQAAATDQVTQLSAEFGPYFDREGLAAVVAQDEQYFLDPATRSQRLRQAAAALAYDAQTAYVRGDDVKAALAEHVQPRDAFGARDFATNPTPIDPAMQAMPQAPQPVEQPRDPATGQFRTKPAPMIVAHVEGGSTPPPPARVASTDPDDDIKSAIRGSGARDVFGRRGW
jgi:hypothetical protein